MTVYHRTAEQKAGDFAKARDFEEHVAEVLGPWLVTEFDHTDRLDIWVPGFFLDVKEKRQRLTERWHRLPGIEERDLFVLDELSVRRALRHYPYAYFLIRDVPESRLFVASIVELCCVERARLNRWTSDKHAKGKWVVNLQNFRRIGRIEDLKELVLGDLVKTPWKHSNCLGQVEPPRA